MGICTADRGGCWQQSTSLGLSSRRVILVSFGQVEGSVKDLIISSSEGLFNVARAYDCKDSERCLVAAGRLY
ncbi:hypothetical protein R1flu_017388 [Riccia fluitans]|uniref:Uncharacterized protein n=1 Tax=Riccia fluitans TaxID=41844 RepID=A0ABD1ZCT8_9MARC